MRIAPYVTPDEFCRDPENVDALASFLQSAPGQALQSVLAGIWRDALGFAGVEMHRRILGLAHVEDLEAIPDPARRVLAERRALALGRQLAVLRGTLLTTAQVCALAEHIETGDLS
jgi:5-methylthioribose kinase